MPKNIKKSRGKLAEGQDFVITGKIDTTSLCVTQPMTGMLNHRKSRKQQKDDNQHTRERDGARKRFRDGRIDR